MKSLVVYSSQSGNTEKLAKAVYENLDGEKDIFPLAQAPEAGDYDLIGVGFWLQAGKPDPKSQEYLASLPEGAKVFLFATHGAAKGSAHASGAMEFAKSLLKNAEVAGAYSCQGEVNPKVLEKVKAKPEPPPWIGDAPAAAGHPDAKDLEELAEIVRAL
ncbi:Flavodoxin [Desulfatibacillum alkenivorans DSM 16219]|jgi:flavodoxin|uniref:Flavodoxin n=1 Tax=Desulfatibacillum alkenivorans DSM 16219 TaxID=1121393 RepID=A0A1M6CHV0_9BACT|nr:flavodoxin family protein [Desulfatibacillum alkenivorans]SHI60278.1 Flavodoxin [Desulfatibacillum alkenivorans DSM 16219]